MKRFLLGIILLIGGVSAYFAWVVKGVEERKVVVHDTIYKDTFLVALRDTVFYDAKWLRRQFETAGKAYWKNYGTLSRRDKTHKFTEPIKKPGRKRRNEVGQPHENFYDKAIQPAQAAYLRAFQDSVKAQEDKLYDR